jgi:hypothetical protein
MNEESKLTEQTPAEPTKTEQRLAPARKPWQAPKLEVLDYAATAAGAPNTYSDGIGYTSIIL